MTNHQKALNALNGLQLRRIGRVGDILWLHFGEVREVTTQQGRIRLVGAWCLEVQTSWRFTCGGRILLGVLDFYAYADDHASEYDWSRGGESRFDRIVADLNQSLMDADVRVHALQSDSVGSISMRFGTGLGFDVFPNFSSDYPDRDYWRLYQPFTEHPHYVVQSDVSQSHEEMPTATKDE